MATAKKSAKGSAKKDDVKPPPPPPEDEIPEITGSEADYEQLLPVAKAVDLRDSVARRVDVDLACHNARKGTEEVFQHKATIAEHLPKVDLAGLEEISRITSALAFATLRLDHLTHPESGIRALLARARPLRRLLLGSARVLAQAGILDPKAVKKIEQGSGQIDVADDCVALASLFTANAAKVKGKTPVTAQQVNDAAKLGAELRGLLRPKRASRKATPTAEMIEATEVRDRFWALLVQRYDIVWRVGAYLFGRDVSERVPALQAFVAGRRAPAKGTAKDEPISEEKAPA